MPNSTHAKRIGISLYNDKYGAPTIIELSGQGALGERPIFASKRTLLSYEDTTTPTDL